MNDDAEVLSELSTLNMRWIQFARAGDFASAWEVSDQALVLRAGIDCSSWPRHHQFLWRGEPLEGKRVLVRCYHGLGDTIQFVRFVPRLRALARDVMLWVQPTLVPLLRPQHRVLALHEGDPGVECDVTIELAEVMHVLRVEPSLMQIDFPYVGATAGRELGASTKTRVGVVWRAGEWSPERSIPCELLRCLQSVPDVEWVVLQRGPALSEWRHDFGRVPRIDGIVTEAQVMRDLDLVISVDTCSAHLAGALGVPVWTLLPVEADWRWMEGRTDTPWYPTMRLFRQRRAGEWGAVLDEVLTELRRSFVRCRPQ